MALQSSGAIAASDYNTELGVSATALGLNDGVVRSMTTKYSGTIAYADGYGKSGVPSSGLQLWLDTANTASYSGSGTTWYDVSGNGRNFVWNTTPSFTSGSNPYFSTSGKQLVGPAANSFGITNTTGYTLVVWAQQNVLNSVGSWNWPGDGPYSRGIWSHATWSDGNIYWDQGGCCGGDTRTVGYAGNYGWSCIVFRYNYSTQTRTMYLNNTLLVTNTATAAAPQLNASAAYFGDTSWDAQMGMVMMYNRALSDTELTKVYNTTKTRFPSGPSATGGTITTSGGYRYHTFGTAGGTFAITATGGKTFYYFVAGGGGGGGGGASINGGGGGGAGGATSGTFSSTGSWAITVGSGGAGGTDGSGGQGANGGNSVFSGATGYGGGGGGTYQGAANGGGCGGGAGRDANCCGGSGSQGYDGGIGGAWSWGSSGGGGGMGGAGNAGGGDSVAWPGTYGNGGSGLSWGPTGGTMYCAGGGGAWQISGGGAPSGGNGGGGAGCNNYGAGTNGTDGLGGGGGASQFNTAGRGGNGVVIFAYTYP